MGTITRFTDIDIDTEEGRLLCYAIGELMPTKYLGKTPNQVLAILKEGIKDN